MANRRISELPSIAGDQVAEDDLFTLVHVFEVDPSLKNRKITISGYKDYLNTYYLTATGGTLYGSLDIQNNLTVQSSGIKVATSRTPASASASGNTGEICWDTSYIYVCTATNTWKRTGITTW
jgi:hypothetical protein